MRVKYIIGRDLMKPRGIIIDIKHQVLRWDDITIPMNMTKMSNTNKLNINIIKYNFLTNDRIQDSINSY